MKAATFFSEQDKAAIETAIAEVETKTAGEVAVMVVDQSDSYPEARLSAGLLFGAGLALAVTELFFAESLWAFLPLALVGGALMGLLSGFMPFVIRFMGSRQRQEARVRERALQAFYEKGLYKTRDNTGVLFFISLLEHRVWVLADAGIYDKISSDELQDFARQVARGVGEGNVVPILCQEIQRVGEVLACHFPIRDDDTNELSNEVIVG
jgi:putative membrane protein